MLLQWIIWIPTLLWTTAYALPLGLLSCLENIKSRTATSLVSPSSPLYDSHRVAFSHLFDYQPAAIFHPASEAEAVAAILCASHFHTPIAPRSGGHSYEAYSTGGQHGSLVLDLAQFQQFSLDPRSNIATIGAGSRLGHIYMRLLDAGGLVVPAGTCPSVGIGGHALGGGFGVLARKHGMLTHNLLSLTLITANGSILTVDPSSHPDLFWALRGAGGGSYGLVTEFRVQAYVAPAIVTTTIITYPFSALRKTLAALADWGRTAPKDLSITTYIDRSKIELEITFQGSQTQMQSTVQPLLDLLGEPEKSDYHEGSWYEAANRWGVRAGSTLEAASLADQAFYHRGRSLVYRQPLSEVEVSLIEKYLSKPPRESLWAYILVDLWGGQIDQPSHPSAFDHHKGVLLSIQFDLFWNSPSAPSPGFACKGCLEWSADFIGAMRAAYSSGSTLEAYQNYIERDLPDSLHAYYGDSLKRLQQIKKAVDPTNLFTFPQAIPLA